MKRNIILTLIVILLGTGAYFLYRNQADPGTSIDRAESNFRIEDPNQISRILITNRSGSTSDLKRVGDHWIVNDAYKVRQSNMEVLLAGMQRQELDHIPNRAASENILKFIATNGIHVEIFDLSGAPILRYWVGGVTQDERGTFFLKDGSTQPYCLTQPGFDGGLRVRYALEPIDWRDVRFWMEDNDKFDTLKLDYPQQRQHAFKIYRKGLGYEVEPLYKTTPRLKGESNALVKSFLTSLSSIACEDYVNDAIEKDSILRMQPFMEMNIIYPDTKSRLRFYPIGLAQKSEFSPAYNRFFIDYENRDFMVAQYNVIKGAFRSYDYFFPK